MIVLQLGLRTLGLLALMLIGFKPVSLAQNTSSVSSPVVDAGDRDFGFRFGWVPGDDGICDSYAYRFDYGMSLSERRSLKLYASAKDGADDRARFTSLNAEYLVELTSETARTWQSGVRFDARLAEGSGANRIGLAWLNQFRLNDRMKLRAMSIVTREFARDGDNPFAFELRSSLGYRLDDGYSLALLAFVKLGTTDQLGVAGQRQQIGPTLSGPLGDQWKWTAGNLFGVSEAAPDNDIRVWISRGF